MSIRTDGTPVAAEAQTETLSVSVAAAWGGDGEIFQNATESKSVRVTNTSQELIECRAGSGVWTVIEINKSVLLLIDLSTTNIRLRKAEFARPGSAQIEVTSLTGEYQVGPYRVQISDGVASRTDIFTDVNTSPVVMTKCMPARIQSADGSIKRARAMGDSSTVRKIAGLVVDNEIQIGAVGRVQTSGLLIATTNQWDSVTGEVGGLVPGAIYWMGAEFGKISRTTPDTTIYTDPWVIEIGTAKSATEMVIRIAVVTQLASD